MVPHMSALEQCTFLGVFSFVTSLYLAGPIGFPLSFCFGLFFWSHPILGPLFGTMFAVLLGLAIIPLKQQINMTWLNFLLDLFPSAVRYFDAGFVVEGEGIQKGRSYLIANFPHGVHNVGAMLHAGFLLRRLNIDVRTAGANVLFRLPILRHLIAWTGVVPVSRGRLLRTLQQPTATFVTPGGIAEMFLGSDQCEHIKLKTRKGFIKLALQAGADIVPTFYLGNSKLFVRVVSSDSFLANLSRKVRASLIPFYGRWMLPIPFRHRVVVLQGNPIRCEKAIPNPTPEQIDQVHTQFTEALVGLYYRHRHLISGWENRELVVE
eukprot:c17884_g1_i1.p1 GENE.c17884_g1_i1~~c17884_g1_i1.p1  ORF type:complete len:321 (+),score=29.96 c17884_g1_i1:129-1091(+)